MNILYQEAVALLDHEDVLGNQGVLLLSSEVNEVDCKLLHGETAHYALVFLVFVIRAADVHYVFFLFRRDRIIIWFQVLPHVLLILQF